jgi:hypothetical protein
VEVDGVRGGHHLVAVTVHEEHWMVDASEVGGRLLIPSMDGCELGEDETSPVGAWTVVIALCSLRVPTWVALRSYYYSMAIIQ